MVGAEVAILADAFRVEDSLLVLTQVGSLGPSLCVVAVLAHPVCVVRFSGVGALGDVLSVLLNGLGLRLGVTVLLLTRCLFGKCGSRRQDREVVGVVGGERVSG